MAFAIRTNNVKANSSVKQSGGYKPQVTSSGSQYGGYKGPKKDRPFCTHCNILGHIIEKCYKIHGYPPGYIPCYKQKQKSQYANAMVNQLSNLATPSSVDKVIKIQEVLEVFLKTLI